MVSVIIPVYDVEKYLRECIDSVISQTYTDLEIILIDDGSPDNCGSICDEYAVKDSRIKVIHQQNKGLSMARNAGIEIATGEYLTFVDSDDCLMPHMIEYLYNACIAYNADMCACGIIRSRNSTTETLKYSQLVIPMQEYEGKEKMKAYIRDGKITSSVWAKIYSSNLFQSIRFPEGKIYEDVFIIYKLIHSAQRIVNIGYEGYLYRINDNGITQRKFIPKDLDMIESKLEQLAFIKDSYPELEEYAVVLLLISCKRLLIKLAAIKERYFDVERRVQQLYRQYIKVQLRSSRPISDKAFALVATISLDLARMIVMGYNSLKILLRR